MEELREIARAHYRAGSPEVQALAYEFYRTMDSDGDGRVNLSEFLAFMRQQGYGYMQNPYFFYMLDLDRNGTLDFFEVMTLYYIIKSGRPFCNYCGKFIPGLFFSCVECFKNPNTTFDLCLDCYRAANCNHNHNGQTQFLDNYTLLQAMRDPTLPQTSSVNFMNEAWNRPTNAIVTLQQYDMHNQPTYNSNVFVQPHNGALVPASSNSDPNWSKWSAAQSALAALEVALSIGCTDFRIHLHKW